MDQRRYEPQYNLQPSNTQYGYADPRHIPPGDAPAPTYRQYPQPNYYPQNPTGGVAQHDSDYKSTRPKEGHRNDQTEKYQQTKFDYQKDDRFYRVPQQQQQQQQQQPAYERPPQRDYQEMVNRYNLPRQDLAEQDHPHVGYDANKGYLVMMRFRESDLSEVVTAVQENISTLHSHNGYVIGFSEAKDMTILLANNDMIVHGQWWDPKFDYKSRYGTCCFWFKDVFQAKRWFESANRLKQPDFPNSNPYQVTAVPLTYGRNKEPMPFDPNAAPVTLLWCEFPHIYERYHNDFLQNYSEPTRIRMKDFGANPHISISRHKAGWPDDANKYGQPGYGREHAHLERVGRSIRTGWVTPETFITVSTFPDMEGAVKFYTDPYYQRELRSKLDNYSNPVFVAITLRPVKGTYKRY